MNVLMVNKFFYIKGGAENSFFHTARLLEDHGHEVNFFSMKHPKNFESADQSYFVSEVDYENSSFRNAVKAVGRLIYSLEARRQIESLIAMKRPQLAHLNNIYHQISPSILHSLRKYHIPIVMSLRDYKVVCAGASMTAGNTICEKCKGGKFYRCLRSKCIKGSTAKSLLSTFEMYLHHCVLNMYSLVDVFISPSKFLKSKVEEMGFKGKVIHLPNFIYACEYEPLYQTTERSICFVGRLSPEKGIGTLIDAVKDLDVILKIVGDGPMRDTLAAKVRDEGLTNVRFLGFKDGDDLKNEIRKSMFLVIPSEWYENNPRSVLEAFALGKPVVGARIGGIPELIKDGETGLTFNPFDMQDLRAKLIEMLDKDGGRAAMGENARHFVEFELSPSRHYSQLMEIYAQAAIK